MQATCNKKAFRDPCPFLHYTCKADCTFAYSQVIMLPSKDKSLVHAMRSTMICTIAMFESLNASVYAVVLVTSNDRQCKSCYKQTHVCVCARGGRGRASAPAFLSYYLHPLHNFFCNIAPKVGRYLRMVMMWGQASHHHACKSHTPMQERVGVCVLLVV